MSIEKDIADRRKDKGFKERLERSIKENRAVLESLGFKEGPPGSWHKPCPNCSRDAGRDQSQ